MQHAHLCSGCDLGGQLLRTCTQSWNLELIAGGSSGVSAAAVAMNHCYAALGTDTVEDTALVLQSIAGYDRLDLQSIDY